MRLQIKLPRIPRPHWPRRPERPAEPDVMPGSVLRAFRVAALCAIAAVVTAASSASFAESYRGLWLWARRHGLAGFWAAAFPLQVDAFIAVGELTLFVAMTDRWGRRDRAGAWTVALLGLAASVAGNVGHVAAHDLQSRGTAAVPPLSAFVALWVGLGVLKRVVSQQRRDTMADTSSPALPDSDETAHGTGAGAPPLPGLSGAFSSPVPIDAEHAALIALKATLAAGNGHSNNQLMTKFGLTRAQAAKVRQLAVAESNGYQPGDGQDSADQ